MSNSLQHSPSVSFLNDETPTSSASRRSTASRGSSQFAPQGRDSSAPRTRSTSPTSSFLPELRSTNSLKPSNRSPSRSLSTSPLSVSLNSLASARKVSVESAGYPTQVPQHASSNQLRRHVPRQRLPSPARQKLPASESLLLKRRAPPPRQYRTNSLSSGTLTDVNSLSQGTPQHPPLRRSVSGQHSSPRGFSTSRPASSSRASRVGQVVISSPLNRHNSAARSQSKESVPTARMAKQQPEGSPLMRMSPPPKSPLPRSMRLQTFSKRSPILRASPNKREHHPCSTANSLTQKSSSIYDEEQKANPFSLGRRPLPNFEKYQLRPRHSPEIPPEARGKPRKAPQSPVLESIRPKLTIPKEARGKVKPKPPDPPPPPLPKSTIPPEARGNVRATRLRDQQREKEEVSRQAVKPMPAIPKEARGKVKKEPPPPPVSPVKPTLPPEARGNVKRAREQQKKREAALRKLEEEALERKEALPLEARVSASPRRAKEKKVEEVEPALPPPRMKVPDEAKGKVKEYLFYSPPGYHVEQMNERMRGKRASKSPQKATYPSYSPLRERKEGGEGKKEEDWKEELVKESPYAGFFDGGTLSSQGPSTGWTAYNEKYEQRRQEPHIYVNANGEQRFLTTVQSAAAMSERRFHKLRRARQFTYEHERSGLGYEGSPARALALLPRTGVPGLIGPTVFQEADTEDLYIDSAGNVVGLADDPLDYLLTRHGYWGQSAEVVKI